MAGAEIKLYTFENGSYAPCDEETAVVCDENGKYTFSAIIETADYYIKATCPDGYETLTEYIPFGDETELTVHIYHKRDGSLEYPFLINGDENTSSTTSVTIEAGKSVYYTMFDINGATISIDNKDAKLEIIVNGETKEILTGEVLSYVLLTGENESSDTNARVLLLVSMVDSTANGEVNITVVAPEIEE